MQPTTHISFWHQSMHSTYYNEPHPAEAGDKSWHHQSSSFTLVPKDEFKSMTSPHMKHSMCTMCSTCKLLHFSVRCLSRGFMDTCQEGWINLQQQYMPLLWAVCGPTHPFTLLARQCVHHRFNCWPTSSYLAATPIMCRFYITIHQLRLSRYHMRFPCSHRHPRHVQHTPIQ